MQIPVFVVCFGMAMTAVAADHKDAFLEISSDVGGFRGYLANEVDFNQTINGVIVDTEIKSEGVSDDGTIVAEIKDTLTIYAPLSSSPSDWTFLAFPEGIAKIKPKGISQDGLVVTGESETNQKQKRLFTWTPSGGFTFHEHSAFDLTEGQISESNAEGISRNGKFITGAVKYSLDDSESEIPILWTAGTNITKDEVSLLPLLSNATIMQEEEYYISTLFLKKLKGSAVNNDGVIVGEVEAVIGDAAKFMFIYWPDEGKYDFIVPSDLTQIPPCATGTCELKAKTINENYEVIIELNGANEEAAMVWQARKPTDSDYLDGLIYIPSPTTQRLKLHAMNNHGYAVGHTYTDDTIERVAVIAHYDQHDGEQVKLLTDFLVDPQAQIQLQECKDIAESGMIGCEGIGKTGGLAAFNVVPMHNGDVDLDLQLTENDVKMMSEALKRGVRTAGKHGIPLTEDQFLQLYDVSGDGKVDNEDIAMLGDYLTMNYQAYLVKEDSGGLSGGGKAGIAVAAVAAVAILTVYLFIRNKKQTTNTHGGKQFETA